MPKLTSSLTAFIFLSSISVNLVSSQLLPQLDGILPSEFISFEETSIQVPTEKPITLLIYGSNFSRVSSIAFATVPGEPKSSCEVSRATPANPVYNVTVSSMIATITLRELSSSESAFYLCFKLIEPIVTSNETVFWIHAPTTAKRVNLKTTTALMPMWVQIILIIILFFLSGLFSGLNLGLMSLDKTELKIIETAGDPAEKHYAQVIRPVREKGNLLLCTVLLGNVLVNTSLTILMDNMTGSGLFAVIASTLGITLFGEIIPQAICSRHGLAIGAKTIWLTKFFMVLTFPVAFPISFILDKILGDEIGQVYSKAKLSVLLKEQQHAGLVAPDEMNIIAGALTMSTKTVEDIMSPIGDAFMLPNSAILDFDTMNDIFAHGFTRIPVYEGDRRNIRAILNVKDLGFINADDKVPLSTVCNFYNRSIVVVPDTTSLEAMLKEFRQGKAHMAFVERLVTGGQGDPYKEMIGLVTLEDVIEEIIQAEIVDETDVFTDNTLRQQRIVRKNDFRMFNTSNSDKPRDRLSPQLKIAALRHLASNIETFKDEFIALTVLQSLLNSNIVIDHVFNSRDDNENVIYKANHWANYAILILQGHALVDTSNEHLVFEAGPFMFFGETVLKFVNEIYPEVSSLKDPELQSAQLAAKARFLPDYTVRATTNLQFLRITAEHYLLARRLTAWVTKLHPLGVLMHRKNSLCSESGQGVVHMHKESTCLRQTVDNSNDFFQCAWDRHVSHMREATRTSVLASLVSPANAADVPPSLSPSGQRRASSRSSAIHSPLRHSVVDGTSLNSNNFDSFFSSSSPRTTPCLGDVNKTNFLNENLKGDKISSPRVEVANQRSSLRFSLPFLRNKTDHGSIAGTGPLEVKLGHSHETDHCRSTQLHEVTQTLGPPATVTEEESTEEKC